MKVFISSDIEGTCSINNWDETRHNHADYAYFTKQMTREVSAACEGAFAAGAEDVLVKTLTERPAISFLRSSALKRDFTAAGQVTFSR